jgi:hypothetical protein
MKKKIANFTSSMMGLFGDAAPNRNIGSRIIEIRQAMLDSLAAVADGPALAPILGRLRTASDVQTLWYLRGDVMVLLAGPLGEAAAKQRIAGITGMFDGLLPSSQKSRPSHLNK